jgi:pyruvate ferredoxin oxidoreductase gamma subunit
VLAGNPILNTPILGALAKLDIIRLDSALDAIRDMFSDERNVEAAKAAFQKVVV